MKPPFRRDHHPRVLLYLGQALLLALLAGSTVSAQDTWTLENRGYYDPLIAEPRAAQISITAIAISDEFPFVQEKGKRPVWDISLGKEIPIVGRESGDGSKDQLGPGQWGIGIWIPVSFHMIEDLRDPSAPILNTDYRFGGMIKFQRGLTERSRFGIRLGGGHESTHIGDEFSLAARRNRPDFERINVSYEYWEYGVSLETEQGGDRQHFLRFRHGGTGLVSSKKGFYSADPLDTNGRIVPRSARHFEPSFGFEWIYKQDATKRGGFGPFISMDARLRTIYNYRKTSASEKEDRQMSFNIMFGFGRSSEWGLQRGSPALFLRYYHGVNPAGQFRNQRDFQLIGVGLHVPL